VSVTNLVEKLHGFRGSQAGSGDTILNSGRPGQRWPFCEHGL